MKWHSLPKNVRDTLLEAGHTEQEVDGWSARDVFTTYCEWHGLIGYSYDLYQTVLALEKLEKEGQENENEQK